MAPSRGLSSGTMPAPGNESETTGVPQRMRILIADGERGRLDQVARTLQGLGHEVVGESGLDQVAAATASLRPDAAIVVVGESTDRALDLIGRIVTEAACPVIAILDVEDQAFIERAA